jgi:Flp pilus assembly pilin Flp
MLPFVVRLHVFVLTVPDLLDARRRDESGQTTAEYTLVLLGAAAIALLIALWVKQGGKVGKLLDAVFDSLIRMVKS